MGRIDPQSRWAADWQLKSPQWSQRIPAKIHAELWTEFRLAQTARRAHGYSMKNPRDLLSIGIGFLLGMVVCYFLMSNEPAASVSAPTNPWRVAQITNRSAPLRGVDANESPWAPPNPTLRLYDKLHPPPKPDFIHQGGGIRGLQPNVVWPDDAPFRQYNQPLIDFR